MLVHQCHCCERSEVDGFNLQLARIQDANVTVHAETCSEAYLRDNAESDLEAEKEEVKLLEGEKKISQPKEVREVRPRRTVLGQQRGSEVAARFKRSEGRWKFVMIESRNNLNEHIQQRKIRLNSIKW